MHRLLVLFAVGLVSLAACGRQPATPPHPGTALLGNEAVPMGPLPRIVVPSHYRIAWTVDPRRDTFTGHVEIDVEFTEKRRAIFLHGRGLNVLAASVRLSAAHSIPAHYTQVDRSGVARLIFVDEVPAGKATLVFDYEAPFGKSLAGLYKVVERGDAYAFTQFESISAREAFPSFDEPGFKTPFQLSVLAPAGDKVVSNTPVQTVSRPANGMVTTLFQWTRPLPTYLIALAVGPLDIVDGGDVPPNQYRNHPIHIRGVTARGNGGRIRYALSLTPKVVSALENYFGISYPFQKLDILAVPDFAAGAMENAGAITFRERLLLLDANAPVDQKRGTLSVQAHEITHQWFGDFVTPHWWDDIWLNESFADWMADKIADEVAPDEDFDTETLRGGFEVMDLDELPSARQIHQPVRGPDDIENAFDSITYNKGASVLRMFESFLGEDVFRRGIHTYLTKFAFRNATEHDFLDTISASAAAEPRSQPEDITIHIDRSGHYTWNGHPVGGQRALLDQLSHMTAGITAPQIVGAFHSFIDQPGIPYVTARLACDQAAVSVQLAQRAYTPIGGQQIDRLWSVPACISDAGGQRICRLLDRRSSNILLGATCPHALMPNDQGKSYYRFALDSGDWASAVEAAPGMGPADRITLLYNLSAGLGAGQARAADLLSLIHAIAPTARWDVLRSIDLVMHDLRLRSLSPPDLAAYRTFVQATFGPRMAALNPVQRPAEAPEKAMARQWLATLLVSEGRDVELMAALTKAAHAYLKDPNSNDVPPELVGEAMRAGLITEGRPFADGLIGAFEQTNQEFFRRELFYAFAGSDDPASIRKLLSLALTSKMRTGEVRYLFEYMPTEPVARDTLWAWYKSNYPALLARLTRDGMGRAPGALGTACDAAVRADLDAFFAAKTSELTGTPRTLALAEEKIDRCIAFRQAKGAEVTAAFRQAH